MEKKNVYEIVSAKILNELAKGVAPWRQPWQAINSGAIRANGQPYKGINQWLLSWAALSSGYSSTLWLTFNQARQWGGGVKKGEKGTIVVFWSFVDRKSKNEDGKVVKDKIPLLRYYTVFNLDQTDKVEVPASIQRKLDAKPVKPVDPIAEAEAIVERYIANDGPSLRWGGDRAFYAPVPDRVRLPLREQFHGTGELYCTLFHELGHSTGHESRLNRPIQNYFGNADYSREELVAELTAAFVCSELGIDQPLPNSASYFKGWQKTFEDDSKAIVWAAARAAKAADLILGREVKDEAEVDEAA